MAERAIEPVRATEGGLSTGRLAPRRVLFGLLEADGWSWATIKAFFWFIVTLLLLGYLPDRAYYFTVGQTVELGIVAVPVVNFCPPTNQGLPCPPPVGSILPWQPSPGELNLPAARAGGGLVQSGTRLLYIGGTDGTVAQGTVFSAELTGDGNFHPWQSAQSLPEPRANAAVAFLAGSVYVIGGTDAAGSPTTSVFVGTPDPQTGQIASWTASTKAVLPFPRTDAAAVVASDGLFLVGGRDAAGPVSSVWKAKLDQSNVLQAWAPNVDLPEPRAGALAGFIGDFLYIYGGVRPDGPSATVLRATIAKAPLVDPTPAEQAAAGTVASWSTGVGGANLPAGREGAAGFVVNGVLYLIGGTGPDAGGQVYWAVPDATGVIAEWKSLGQSNMPASLTWVDGAAITSGSTGFLIGGSTSGGLTAASARTNLAPQPPFFQLGLFGGTVPGLGIPGAIGQQLGWIAAGTVGAGNFILLVVIGVAAAHPAQTRALWDRLRRRMRRGRA